MDFPSISMEQGLPKSHRFLSAIVSIPPAPQRQNGVCFTGEEWHSGIPKDIRTTWQNMRNMGICGEYLGTGDKTKNNGYSEEM